MKNKRVIIYIGIAITIVIIVYIIFRNLNVKEGEKILEYTPQEELADSNIRKTIVSVYFKNIETNTLTPETVCIDVKELVNNPYMKLLNLIATGSSNEKLESTLPEGTKINNVYLKENIVYVDFSKEFVDNAPRGVEEEGLLVYSIVNTLTELNEVSGVKILIEGEENKSFLDNGMNFNEVFVRND